MNADALTEYHAALAALALVDARYDAAVRDHGHGRNPFQGVLFEANRRVREARAAAGIQAPAPAPRVLSLEEQIKPFARAFRAMAVSYAAARFERGEGVEAVWNRSVGGPLPVLVIGEVVRLPNGRILTGRRDVRTPASAAQAA